MKTIQVGDLKTHFSEILNQIRNGDEIIISYGRKKEKIAKIIPYKSQNNKIPRKIGILKGKASYKINDNFELTDEEFLNL
jgi:antitoxin (DNA-binding transcriptional repressor) of toxin-antitoxin stability system